MAFLSESYKQLTDSHQKVKVIEAGLFPSIIKWDRENGKGADLTTSMGIISSKH